MTRSYHVGGARQNGAPPPAPCPAARGALLATLEPRREPFLAPAGVTAADALHAEAPDDGVERPVERRVPEVRARGEEAELLGRVAHDAGRRHADQPDRKPRPVPLPEAQRRIGDRLPVVGRLGERYAPGEEAELARAEALGELELQYHDAPPHAVMAQAARDGVGVADDRLAHAAVMARVGRERALLAVGLGREVRLDYSRVLTAGQPDEVIGSGSPDERREPGRRPRRELADGRDPGTGERGLGDRADAQTGPRRPRGQDGKEGHEGKD